MLWVREAAVEYDALGFITRYATSEDMRREVEHRRIEQ